MGRELREMAPTSNRYQLRMAALERRSINIPGLGQHNVLRYTRPVVVGRSPPYLSLVLTDWAVRADCIVPDVHIMAAW